MCWRVSDWKQKEHADIVERGYLQRFSSSKSIVDVLDDKIKDVFRHIMMNFSPKFASMLTALKKYR